MLTNMPTRTPPEHHPEFSTICGMCAGWHPIPGSEHAYQWRPSPNNVPPIQVHTVPRKIVRSDGRDYTIRGRILKPTFHRYTGFWVFKLATGRRGHYRSLYVSPRTLQRLYDAIPDHPRRRRSGGSVTTLDIDGMTTLLAKIFAGGMPPLPDAECRKVDPKTMDSVDAPIDGIRVCGRCAEIRACEEWLASGLKRNHVTGIIAGRVIHYRQ
jgi:hypothetical protein